MKKVKFIVSIAVTFAAGIILSGCVNCAAVKTQKKTDPARLQIGWGKRSIAMKGPAAITGQSHLRVALGEYSPVYASALAITNAKETAVFVSVDVVSVSASVLKGMLDILKKEAPEIPGNKIIVNASHTHDGPSTANIVIKYPNKVEVIGGTKVQEFLARQIADAVKEAWQNRKDGSIAYGYGFATVGFSRRTLYLDDTSKRFGNQPGYASNGHCIMYGNTKDDKFAGYEAGMDPFINIMYTFDADDKLSGAIVNVPCPAQNMEAIWHYYAGFWANVREKMAAKYGDIGLICQSAAAGDLAPRQLHYNEAELRRYKLKYPELVEDYKKNPIKFPYYIPREEKYLNKEILEIIRAEDAANRVMTAFDEVLSWASKEKLTAPEFQHEVKTVKLDRFYLPPEILAQEKEYNKKFMAQKFMTEGDKWQMLIHNSTLNARRNKVNGVIKRFEEQQKTPALETDIHVVRIGDAAFATNRFELFMDFMHRIQGRSPFTQTFIVQLVTDTKGVGSYLATERGEKNKGYGATPYSCQVSPKGGQQLVEHTVEMLKNMKNIPAAQK
ncbi:MAG: hypothetical protein IKB71_00425 [Lentisphaeria bacterium]|nr:hypothetical protein [Lentisphaeria bacterium]